jgi:hypothetical protein
MRFVKITFISFASTLLVIATATLGYGILSELTEQFWSLGFLAIVLCTGFFLLIRNMYRVVRSNDARNEKLAALCSGVGTAISLLFALFTVFQSFLMKSNLQPPILGQPPERAELNDKQLFLHYRSMNLLPPDLEPWPPPTPSARAELPSTIVRNANSLADVAQEIIGALHSAGYLEYGFFYVPYGFALVTHLEQIEDDGTPRNDEFRWRSELAVGMRRFSLSEYLRVLFLAPAGRYRNIMFIVSPVDFAPTDTQITRQGANKWLLQSQPSLPEVYSRVRFDQHYKIIALIYEFYAYGRTSEPVIILPSAIPAVKHLTSANLWAVALTPRINTPAKIKE